MFESKAQSTDHEYRNIHSAEFYNESLKEGHKVVVRKPGGHSAFPTAQ